MSTVRILPVSTVQGAVRVTLDAVPQKSDKKRSVICTLDKSGSMSGEPLTNASRGLINFIEKHLDELEKLYVICYDERAFHVQVTPANKAKVISDLRNTYANGCTDFSAMFMIVDFLGKEHPNDDFVIYVFTDGKHEPSTRNDTLYTRMKTQLKNTLATRAGKSWVKARAFSNGVDVKAMEELTRFGSDQGDFQYAFSIDEITTMLDTDDMLSIQSSKGVLNIGDSHLDLVFYEDVDGRYTAQTVVDVRKLASIGKMSVTVSDGKTNTVLDTRFELIPDDDAHAAEYFDAMIFAFSTQLKTLSTELVQMSGNRTAVDRYIDTLKELDTFSAKCYDARYSKIRSRIARKAYGAKYTDFRKTLGEILSSAVRILRGATTQDMARVLNAGFTVARRGLQRRIDAMAATGIAKLEASDAALLQLKFEEKQVHADLDSSDIRCMISLSGPAEATLDTDVICMTGFMTRPEVAIASSDQIRITHINSLDSALLWSIFSDELLKGLDGRRAPEVAQALHGGFDVSNRMKKRDSDVVSSGVVTDAYRGKLNFAYPLYIHSHHWGVAKHYLPRIVAWMTTLDFAAQSFEQIKTVPFVLVGSAICDFVADPSEHNLQLFMNTFRVAWQVCLDYNLQHIQEELDAWIAGYAGRVPKNMSSLFVFMAKLMFTGVDFKTNTVNKLPTLDNSFWISILEEHVRRTLAKTQVLSDTYVAEICGYKKFVNVTVDSQLDPVKFARLIDKTAVVADEKKVYVVPTFEEKDLVNDDPRITLTMQKILKLCNNLHLIQAMCKFYEFFRNVDRVTLIQDLDSNLGIINDRIKDTFKGFVAFKKGDASADRTIPFGLSMLEFYRMTVVGAKLSDNNARESSKMSYLDGNSILIDSVVRCIQAETTRQMTVMNSNVDATRAKLFAKTDDVRVAMGIMTMCANVGDHPFHHMLVELQSLEDVPHREDKIKMLVDGEFNGVQLYRRGFHYPANKRNRKRLIYASDHQRARENKAPMGQAYWDGVFRWATDH